MNHFFTSFIRVTFVFVIITILIEYALGTGESFIFITNTMVMLFLLFVLLVLIAFEIVLAAVERMLIFNLSPERKAAYLENKFENSLWAKWSRLIRFLTQSKPTKFENEIIIDHNYDGIRELNNALPPWWLYTFYITIIFSAIYLVKYHILDGPDPIQELEMANLQAEQDIALYRETAKDYVSAETVQILTEPHDLSKGKAIYSTNCVACHLADGGGSIGPNLTDNYWINGGGSIKTIFRVISDGGRDGKGMIAWSTILRPSEIAQVSSYVTTLIGTTPSNPKAPEGELWNPNTIQQ